MRTQTPFFRHHPMANSSGVELEEDKGEDKGDFASALGCLSLAAAISIFTGVGIVAAVVGVVRWLSG